MFCYNFNITTLKSQFKSINYGFLKLNQNNLLALKMGNVKNPPNKIKEPSTDRKKGLGVTVVVKNISKRFIK